MSVSRFSLLLFIVFPATLFAGSQLQSPLMAAGQLVGQVVYNEQNDHREHGYWRYWVQKRTPTQTTRMDQVETKQGPVTVLTLENGHAPSMEAEQEQQARLEKLLTSPEEQARHLRQYDEDEARIGRILALLPEAFVFEYAAPEDSNWVLHFHPNPAYTAHTIEARIFHSMSGTIVIDSRCKRLVSLDGKIDENVDFGFGILGRLYKGGWFHLKRVQVSPTDWKTESLEVHMNIRALLVKSFARETSETRGGFIPVPAGITLAQGLEILHAGATEQTAQVQARRPIATPSEIAMRP